jgi:hypothetical protein
LRLFSSTVRSRAASYGDIPCFATAAIRSLSVPPLQRSGQARCAVGGGERGLEQCGGHGSGLWEGLREGEDGGRVLKASGTDRWRRRG